MAADRAGAFGGEKDVIGTRDEKAASMPHYGEANGAGAARWRDRRGMGKQLGL
ncbi:MAG: hypothetical protein SVP26_00325 [Chloroflexota bacterium]|nr:hypothetical protein [Chloroflexota bacterium]